MVKCDDITEPFILWNTLTRFKSSKIYTSIGDILLVVNPFKNIPGMYSEERLMEVVMVVETGNTTLEPHIFNMANLALRSLTYDNITQAIIISGESGAGKTEQTKKCLQVRVLHEQLPSLGLASLVAVAFS